MKNSKEALPLSEAVTHLLEECRMVLPGMQALFGFQLIAVFNTTFRESLSSSEKYLHLAAIGLIAVAVALVMAPAALHAFPLSHRPTVAPVILLQCTFVDCPPEFLVEPGAPGAPQQSLSF